MAKTKNWYVNQEGDITDGNQLIAEPNYISRECHKNAQLMAAAPELLEALESVLSFFLANGDFEMHECFIEECRRDVLRAKEVIKKAKTGA